MSPTHFLQPFARRVAPWVRRSLLVGFGLTLAMFPLVNQPGLSQGLPGLTIFGGKGENELNYRLDFGGSADSWERYRLRISARKMRLAAAQFSIAYSPWFNGTFDPENVEVLVGGDDGKPAPIQEIVWNKENNRLDIYMKAPVPAGENVTIMLSNVKNPRFGGVFHFNCEIQTPGDVPLLRYIGTWIISIN